MGQEEKPPAPLTEVGLKEAKNVLKHERQQSILVRNQEDPDVLFETRNSYSQHKMKERLNRKLMREGVLDRAATPPAPMSAVARRVVGPSRPRSWRRGHDLDNLQSGADEHDYYATCISSTPARRTYRVPRSCMYYVPLVPCCLSTRIIMHHIVCGKSYLCYHCV